MNLEDKMIINQFGAVPPSLLPEILEGLKKDMEAALEEWDEVKAAEIRHTAELLEKHLDPLHRTTAEEIKEAGKDENICGALRRNETYKFRKCGYRFI